MQLSVLVVYGAVIAKVLVGVVAVAILGVVWWTGRRRDAMHARAELRTRRSRIAAPAEGDATIRGTFHEPDDRRWIECAGESIDLDGSLRVVRGAHVDWPRGTARHAVRDGDDVIASGQLARRLGAEDAASSYRQAAPGWTMTPSASAAAIELMASRPAAAARRPGWRWLVASAVLSYGALHAAGTKETTSMNGAVNAARQRRDSALWQTVTDNAFRVFSHPSIAAALPGSREDALQVLLYLLDEHLPRRTHDAIELKLEVSHLLGCHAETSTLFDEARFERAYAVATGCGETKLAFMSLLYLGRFEEAARMLAADDWAGLARLLTQVRDPVGLAGATMIAAGRWRDAAQLADVRASWRLMLVSPNASVVDPNLVNRDYCLADLFRAYGGDRHAVERIHTRASATHSGACTELEELATGQVEGWLAQELAADTPLYRNHFGWRIAFEYGASTVWLAPFATSSAASGASLEWLALYHAYIGDLAAARQDAAALRAIMPDDRFELSLQISLGAPVGEMHALADLNKLDYAEPQPAWRLHNDWLKVPRLKDRAQILTIRQLFQPDCDNRVDSAYWSAMSGDGGPLASLIQDCPDLTRPRSNLAVLPYVVEHREALREALRELPFDGFFSLSLSASRVRVPEVITQLVHHRDLMRVSGSADLAAHWQEAIDRYAAMLRDRNRAIAFHLWQ